MSIHCCHPDRPRGPEREPSIRRTVLTRGATGRLATIVETCADFVTQPIRPSASRVPARLSCAEIFSARLCLLCPSASPAFLCLASDEMRRFALRALLNLTLRALPRDAMLADGGRSGVAALLAQCFDDRDPSVRREGVAKGDMNTVRRGMYSRSHGPMWAGPFLGCVAPLLAGNCAHSPSRPWYT